MNLCLEYIYREENSKLHINHKTKHNEQSLLQYQSKALLLPAGGGFKNMMWQYLNLCWKSTANQVLWIIWDPICTPLQEKRKGETELTTAAENKRKQRQESTPKVQIKTILRPKP